MRGRALGRLKQGQRNKTEAAYEQYLEMLRRTGDVDWYRFEAIKLRLADKTFYEPDFLVMLPGGMLEVHEIKGHWEDDARVKIKVAAEQFPFRFIALRPIPKRLGGGYAREVFE